MKYIYLILLIIILSSGCIESGHKEPCGGYIDSFECEVDSIQIHKTSDNYLIYLINGESFNLPNTIDTGFDGDYLNYNEKYISQAILLIEPDNEKHMVLIHQRTLTNYNHPVVSYYELYVSDDVYNQIRSLNYTGMYITKEEVTVY